MILTPYFLLDVVCFLMDLMISGWSATGLKKIKQNKNPLQKSSFKCCCKKASQVNFKYKI